jgi:aquaporin Z
MQRGTGIGAAIRAENRGSVRLRAQRDTIWPPGEHGTRNRGAVSKHARILVAELIGTMILILGGPGTVIFGQFLGFNIGVLGVSLAFGLSLLCAAYLFGHISGGHINPAVTIGMWALKRTEGRAVPFYLVGQILGAALGSFIIFAILETGDNTIPKKATRELLFGGASNGFANHSPSGFAFWSVVITEVVFTALFILAIAVTTRSSAIVGFAGIPIGLMLALIHMITIPIDNTSVNPARSFSTVLFGPSWGWEQLWVFIVFPLLGGLIGAGIWRFITTGEEG